MTPRGELLVDRIANIIKADESFPEASQLSDFRLKTIIRDALETHVVEELCAKRLIDLTAIVIQLAKLQLS